MKVKNTIPSYSSDVVRKEEQRKVYRMLLLKLQKNPLKTNFINSDSASC